MGVLIRFPQALSLSLWQMFLNVTSTVTGEAVNSANVQSAVEPLLGTTLASCISLPERHLLVSSAPEVSVEFFLAASSYLRGPVLLLWNWTSVAYKERSHINGGTINKTFLARGLQCSPQPTILEEPT